MVFVDPLFQTVLAKACKGRGIPVVYDEIFVGLYRLGVQSTRELVCVANVVRVLARAHVQSVLALFLNCTSNPALIIHGNPRPHIYFATCYVVFWIPRYPKCPQKIPRYPTTNLQSTVDMDFEFFDFFRFFA
jgi:hypothetical protein